MRAGTNSKWYTQPTDQTWSFICQLASPSLRGKEKLDLIYKKDQLTFRSFHVWYEYKAASQQVLDSWEDKRMTGFKLTWRIERPTLMTNKSEMARNNREATPNPLLVKIVQLAQYLRMKENMTKGQILDKVVSGKMQNINILAERGLCSNDQIKSDKLHETFPKLVSIVEVENQEEAATERNILTGFELYHLILFCPEMDMKLYNFVDQLFSSESKRTIIQSYANLFHSGVLKGTTSTTLAKEFYLDLAATLNLQYGNILLATSTNYQLQALRDIDVPFFTNNTDLVITCNLDSQCDRLQDIIKNLGEKLSLPCLNLPYQLLQVSTMHQRCY